MVSIVALLYVWEETVKTVRERIPQTLFPVIDSMLAEMAGLGFVGLFLGVVVVDGPLGNIVGGISERFLGNEEILLESFEFLHTAFFEVGIAFFVISGLTVTKVLQRLDSLQTVTRAVFDVDNDGRSSLAELADVLQVDTLVVDRDGDGELSDEEISQALRSTPVDTLWEEIAMTDEQIKAEALIVRERLLETGQVKADFRIDEYFTKVFGKNLEEIVELSPLTWLPLIPALSLSRSVDLSRDIVSASSPNAALSCGYFLGSTTAFGSNALLVLLALIWGFWNFWKITMVKEMLMPTLVRDSNFGGKARLLPPRYVDPKLMEEFNSSPSIFGWYESLFGEPARNDQERLFGIAGKAGPELYRNSIKYQTWLLVAQIVFWGGQIVARDINALVRGLDVGYPDLLLPELGVYGLFTTLALLQLSLVPQTFLNYCLVTSIEDLAQENAITEALIDGENTKEHGVRVQNQSKQSKAF